MLIFLLRKMIDSVVMNSGEMNLVVEVFVIGRNVRLVMKNNEELSSVVLCISCRLSCLVCIVCKGEFGNIIGVNISVKVMKWI